jgi:hypothetical protein
MIPVLALTCLIAADWLEYLESEDSVHIIDFKTGVGEEAVDSLQLPIYYLLAHNCQTREVKKLSTFDDDFIYKKLPDLDKSKELVMKIGKEMKLARQLERFKCPEGEGGCKHCLPLERILRGESTYVGEGDYHTLRQFCSSQSVNHHSATGKYLWVWNYQMALMILESEPVNLLHKPLFSWTAVSSKTQMPLLLFSQCFAPIVLYAWMNTKFYINQI